MSGLYIPAQDLLTANFSGYQLAATQNYVLSLPYSGDKEIWLERFEFSGLFPVSGGNWNIKLEYKSEDNSNFPITSLPLNNPPALTWVNSGIDIQDYLDDAAKSIYCVFEKVSGTANLFCGATLYYKLI